MTRKYNKDSSMLDSIPGLLGCALTLVAVATGMAMFIVHLLTFTDM